LTRHPAFQFAFSDGHTLDFTLFKEGIGYSLPHNTLVFVDVGYLGILKFHENTFMPAKRSRNHPVTQEDKQLKREIAKMRIEVEYFNAKFKNFQIMAQLYRNRRKRFELRSWLICGISNHGKM
ncbi:transposase, partial [Streptococcus suis]